MKPHPELLTRRFLNPSGLKSQTRRVFLGGAVLWFVRIGGLMGKKFKVAGGLVSIVVLFFVLVRPLLTADPVVFSDETAFANVAYHLVSPESFSTTPFSSRLPSVEEAELIYHGPIYYWFLALALKLFGFGIVVIRVTSVCIGIAALLVGFFLANKILKDIGLSLAAVCLLAIDGRFLISAKFGRPEILALFFNFLTLLCYRRALEKPGRKNHLLTGFFASLGVLTHYLLGAIAPLVILCHLLLSKNRAVFKKGRWRSLISVPVLCALGWGGYLFFSLSALERATVAASQRLNPEFYSLKAIFTGNLYTKVIFLIYFLGPIWLFIRSKKDDARLFLLVNFLVTFVVVAFGGSNWYLPLLVFPACLAVLRVGQGWWDGCRTGRCYIWLIPVGVLFIVNLIVHLGLVRSYRDYSYDDYARKISSRLARNSKVLLRRLIPEPYFFLVQHRPDLKLAYEQFYDYDQSNFKAALSQADYVVTRGTDYMVLRFWKQLESSNDPQRDAKYNAVVEKYNVKTVLVDYLKDHAQGVSLIGGTEYHFPVAIFKLDADGE